MASNNKRIQVGELDFDAIKANLKNFLKGQAEFQDYDFEGSGLSVLLDVLAYNTHYNGVYTNLAVNEMFLDSASKRASVVSLAKMLGYIPRSAKCSKVVVTATITAPTSAPAVATLPALQPFTTSIDNKTYTFYNRGAQTVARSTNGTYTFTNLELTEGAPLQYKYTVSAGSRYIIPNANVDLDTLTVAVQETASSVTFKVFTRADTLLQLDDTSSVYFIKEIDDGLCELTFGDGVIGKKLEEGNVITLNYFVSSLEEPNKASIFTYNGATLIGSSLTVVANDVANGGAASESIDEIKYNAPRFYAAQNRAVTVEDYKALILKYFSAAETVSVWGGENNDPPIYGKTFICIKPKDALKLTNMQKEEVLSEILQSRSVVSITPVLVDPEYFNVKITTTVYYNSRETTKTPDDIASIVKQAIYDYDDNELQRFDGVLRYSKLLNTIDNADPSIVNNITKLIVTREFTPKFGVAAEYRLNLINPISQEVGKHGSAFSTTGFYINGFSQICYLDDDSVGNIGLYYVGPSLEKIYLNKTIGVIDYTAGKIVVRNLNIVALADGIFEMQVKPESYDVVSALNQLVQISRDLLVVNVVADETINGDLQGGFNYKFTSIRS
jgi:hypothetical protein